MADTDRTAPPPPLGPPLDALPGGGAGGRRGPARFTRRNVLRMAAAGSLVGAGLLANRWIDDSPDGHRRPSSRGAGAADAAPTTTAP
jgi:hypothetical protein